MLRHGQTIRQEATGMHTNALAVTLHTLAVAAGLALFATGATAQVYRCTTPEGQTIFSDRPCGPDAQTLEPPKAPRAAPVRPAPIARNQPEAARAHPPPYFGMTKERYDLCVSYGKTVMRTQRARPGSTAHQEAYARWDDACGFEVMRSLARDHGFELKNAPLAPLPWAEQPQ
jgi:hypothetical protein